MTPKNPPKTTAKKAPAEAGALLETTTRIDVFTTARDALRARWNELAALYPEIEPTGDYVLEANAQDIVSMLALGMLEEAECRIPPLDARDIVLLHRVLAVDHNEVGASSKLHHFLANQLHHGTATTTANCLLAAMHRSLACGMAADDAMRSKPAPKRPSKAPMHDAVRRFMQSEQAMRELMKASGQSAGCRTESESFKEAEQRFGLKKKTIQNLLTTPK